MTGVTRSVMIDTSAWIEFLRDTGSPVCNAVDRMLSRDILICDVIAMEVLAGGRDERHVSQLRGLLERTSLVSVEPLDYESAAGLYRACRFRGETVRKLIDCLIAAAAIRCGAELLHSDADFNALERHTDLRIYSVLRR